LAASRRLKPRREELRREVRAADARRVRDRRLLQRAYQRVDGGDVGFRRAGAHRHADARQHEVAARAEPTSPEAIKASMACAEAMTTSARSPRASRVGSESGAPPVEAPNTATTS
jgi:hypothetical protein